MDYHVNMAGLPARHKCMIQSAYHLAWKSSHDSSITDICPYPTSSFDQICFAWPSSGIVATAGANTWTHSVVGDLTNMLFPALTSLFTFDLETHLALYFSHISLLAIILALI